MWDAVLSGHVLRLGQSGPEVKELQKRLVAAGYATGVDGDFGAGTDKAVKAFQKANGLPDDGVVGVDTAAAIDKKGAPAATPPATTPTTDTPTTTPATDAPTTSVPIPTPAPGRAEWARVTAGKLTLQQNASGPVVLYLQSQLVKAGFTVDMDGQFGPATERAVKAFQRANHLGADGVVGERTASLLG